MNKLMMQESGATYVEWYETFFEGLAADFWREITPSQLTDEETVFLCAALDVSSPATLLDVPCGYGRHVKALSKQGFQIVGVDISETFIQQALAHVRADPLMQNAVFCRGDMRRLQSVVGDRRFDGAYCLGNSFGYLNAEETQAFAAQLALVLKPGGRFVLETAMVAESLLPNMEARIEMDVSGIHFVAENVDYDPSVGALITEFYFTRGSQSTTATMCHYIFTVAQLCQMMASAGLTVVGLYGNKHQKNFEIGDSSLLAVFERAA